MQSQEKQLIDALFQKLGQASAQAGPRDAEAEALINEHLRRIPGGSYYLAQAVIIQQQALKQAEARIAELERRAGAQSRAGSSSILPEQTAARRAAPAAPQQSGGGGFLAGAAQTALGIGGGILLANAGIELARGIFGGDDFSVDDLFDAYDAGYEDSALDEATYEAGYEDAVDDLDDAGFDDDFFGADDDWGDEW